MNVNRMVVLSSIEPSPVSMRVPAGMETRIAFSYYAAGAATPYPIDIAAQLVLSGRSDGRKLTYSVPATDAVNGLARATIPAGDLVDPNGYRMALYGTVNSEPLMVGMGMLDLTRAAGPEAVPPDVIDQIPLDLKRGEDAILIVALWYDAGKSSPVDLATTLVTATITAARGGAQLVPFLVTPLGGNEVQLTLTGAEVTALPDSCWWSLTAASADGSRMLAEGEVTVHT